MNKPAIVVIAYNRPDSLKRLLKSVSSAIFSDDTTLVISIDKSNSTEVIDVANSFEWKHGEKRVIAREENLGLKKHVLECGNLVNEYGSIIVLEDDLYVSKDFYSYACAALNFTETDEKIAGVSLYNHLMNVHVREPFEAIDDGYDNYYMQFAQSWGQAYTKDQWNSFIKWMEANGDRSIASKDVPENVSTWSDKSWLKFYIKYVIETDKYFIYPRVSYTTNFGDEGTHASEAATDLQVSLAAKKNRDFYFSSIEQSESVYDAFFENMKVGKKLTEDTITDQNDSNNGNGINLNVNNVAGKNTDAGNVCIDLYGYKPVPLSGLYLSSKVVPFKVLKSYGRALRPVDANIYNDISGDDFRLYDLSSPASETKQPVYAKRVLYNYKALNVKKMMAVIKFRLKKK